jgi:hypothetical protein
MSNKISAYSAINGATITLFRDNFYMTTVNTSFVGCKEGSVGTTGWRIKFRPDSLFEMTDTNGSTVYCYRGQNNTMRVNVSTGSGTENLFFFSPNNISGDRTVIDPKSISFDEFNGNFYMKDHPTAGALGFTQNSIMQSWGIPDDRRRKLTVLIMNASPTSVIFNQIVNDPTQIKQCCTDAFKGNDDASRLSNDVCNQLGYANGNDTCDAFMDKYCNGNITDSSCGCYSNYVTNEIFKLPAQQQKNASLLRAQPSCWLPSCSQTGYKNKSNRLQPSCNITICDATTTVNGSDNILKDVSQQQFCNGDKQTPIGGDASSAQMPTTPFQSAGAPIYLSSETTEKSTEGFDFFNPFFILFFILVIIVGFAVIYYVTNKSDVPTVTMVPTVSTVPN